jgi:predicted DNA-binding transcriptional regulator YafY
MTSWDDLEEKLTPEELKAVLAYAHWLLARREFELAQEALKVLRAHSEAEERS